MDFRARKMNDYTLIAIVFAPACLLTFIQGAARLAIQVFHRRVEGRRTLLLAGLDTSDISRSPWIIGANLLVVVLSQALIVLLGIESSSGGTTGWPAAVVAGAELSFALAWIFVLVRNTVPSGAGPQ